VEAWTKFEESMDKEPFLVSTLVNKACFATTLVDTGCTSYGLVDSRFATKHNLQRIPISPRDVTGFDAPSGAKISEVAVMSIDIDGHVEERAFAYIVPRLALYDMILGMAWVKKQGVQIDGSKLECVITSTGTVVRNRAKAKDPKVDCVAVSAVSFSRLTQRKRRTKVEVFAASMADINKALASKVRTDSRTKLPEWCQGFLDVFSKEKATELPPLRGAGVDHEIQLEKVDGKEPQVPW
jgi:predicted aspartyl protease